jgi:lipopolysaccharide export system protein LptA
MTFRNRMTTRVILGAALAAAAGFAGFQQLGAQALSGHDSNAPVNYAADRIE